MQAINNFLDRLVKRIQRYYAKLTTGSADAEAVAQTGESLAKLQKIFAAAIVEASDNYTAYGAVDSGTVQMQARQTEQSAQEDITAKYQKTVDGVLNGTHTDKSAVLLGYTPSIYQELGMPSLPFVIGPGHIYSAAKTEAEAKLENRYSKRVHYHGLGDTAVKNIYEATKDPVMVIAAKDVDPRSTPLRSTHSIVAIVDVGLNGEHLLLPVEITAKRTVGGQEMDVNVLSSAYTKKVSELVREAVAIENTGDVGVYYVKKGATLPADSGVQFPIHLSKKIASGSIIHSFSEKVNMNILDQTQSRQFKRWFGDWQNDPQAASKIVNADGTPKVVYHGSAEQFTVFSYGHIGSSTGVGILGDGFYFTDKKRLAKNYGGNVYPVYLRMKKPYMATESDAYKLRTTDIQAQGYDGVILRAPQGDVYMVFENTQIKSATDNVGTFDGSDPDIRYQARGKVDKSSKTFKKDKNANGVFVADALIDLADPKSKWWTGRYNHDIFSMSKSDDTEFRQFYQEIEKRTRDMEDYGDPDQPTIDDSFTVQDGKGNGFIYRVKLDGYLHGVVLEKIDVAKHEQSMKRYERGVQYGGTDADISRRTAAARNEVEGYSLRDSRNRAPAGNPGSNGLGSGSSQGNQTGNNSGRKSANQKVPDVTKPSTQFQARPLEETSNRYLLVNTLESAAQTDAERQKLQQYRDQIQNAENLEDRLDKLNRRIFEYSFAPGPRDTAKLNEMRETAKRMARQDCYGFTTLTGSPLRKASMF